MSFNTKMKRILFITLALLAIVGRAFAQNTISCAETTARSGQQVVLPIELTNEAELAIVGVSFTMTLPEGVTIAKKSNGSAIYALESLRLDPDFFSVTPELYSDNSIGIRISPVNATVTLQGTEGAIMTITVNVAENMAEGNYEVSFTENSVSVREGTNNVKTVKIDDSTSTLAVSNVVELDENSTSVPESATSVNVCVKRTINENVWSTICLPFAMSEAQTKEVFGDDVELADFEGAESEYEGDDVVSIKVNFTRVNSIEANKPCIIKVSQAVSEFSLADVNITPDEDEAYIEFDNGKTGGRRVVYSGFYGTYHAETVLPEFTLFLNEGKFWYSTGLTKMKAFRAYFEFLDVLTEVENAGVKIFVAIDDEETRIEGISTETAQGDIYDLGGRKVAKPSQSGVYIVNGKKVMVK